MFQQRQLNDVYQLIEVSFATVTSPGAITSGNKAVVSLIAPVLGSINGTQSATFNLGDFIEAIPSAAVGSLGGLLIEAQPTASGVCAISFYNASAGTITLNTAAWTFVVQRFTNTLI